MELGVEPKKYRVIIHTSAFRTENEYMSGEAFVDYYEILQLSFNADADTVSRVYRLLAQRFHPDNKDTGNADMFRQVTEAYRVLCDVEKRAAYDVKHKESRRLNWKIFDQSNSGQGVDAEKRKREGVLALLYRKRSSDSVHPAMTLKDLEDLLGVPKEHLEFTLWYLKENHCVVRADNAQFTITIKGVDAAESLMGRPAETPAAPSSTMRLLKAANDRLAHAR